MAAAFAFTGIYLMSLLVALLAALQLGDFFNAGGEFGLVIAVVAVFTIAAFLVLASVYTTGRAGVLALVALILAICALTLILLPGVIWHMADRSVDPFML